MDIKAGCKLKNQPKVLLCKPKNSKFNIPKYPPDDKTGRVKVCLPYPPYIARSNCGKDNQSQDAPANGSASNGDSVGSTKGPDDASQKGGGSVPEPQTREATTRSRAKTEGGQGISGGERDRVDSEAGERAENGGGAVPHQSRKSTRQVRDGNGAHNVT